MINISNLNLSFGEKENKQVVLKDLNLEVNNEDLVTIIGKSGSGKSSLLKIISGFLKEDNGKIIINNKDLSNLYIKDKISYLSYFTSLVWQDFKLIDEFNIKNNILLPLKIHNIKFEEEYFNFLINKLGIENLLYKFPDQISGGEKQRSAFARALITKPKILLADEPTGSLDSKSSDQLIDLIKTVSVDFADLIILVTHDMKLAKIGNTKYELENGRLIKYD